MRTSCRASPSYVAEILDLLPWPSISRRRTFVLDSGARAAIRSSVATMVEAATSINGRSAQTAVIHDASRTGQIDLTAVLALWLGLDFLADRFRIGNRRPAWSSLCYSA